MIEEMHRCEFKTLLGGRSGGMAARGTGAARKYGQ
jgi:hypothetical protein